MTSYSVIPSTLISRRIRVSLMFDLQTLGIECPVDTKKAKKKPKKQREPVLSTILWHRVVLDEGAFIFILALMDF